MEQTVTVTRADLYEMQQIERETIKSLHYEGWNGWGYNSPLVKLEERLADQNETVVTQSDLQEMRQVEQDNIKSLMYEGWNGWGYNSPLDKLEERLKETERQNTSREVELEL